MSPGIGDMIHHDGTDEEGRIVRLFEFRKGIGYIVTTRNRHSGRETEALWYPSEIRELKERARRARTEPTDHPQATCLDWKNSE